MTMYEKQVNENISNDRKVREIRHDMKHHLRVLNEYAQHNNYNEIKEYLSHFANDLDDAANVSNTGNLTIDSLVNFYASKASDKGIDFEYTARVPENFEFNYYDYDINIVLGNIMDNAVKYSTLAKEPKVKLDIVFRDGALYIVESNTCHKKNGKNENKTDLNGLHGYGIINVSRIVEKHNGKVSIEHTDDRYVIKTVTYT